MFTLVALFCSTAEASYCLSATPPNPFESYAECVEFAEKERGTIDLDAVTYDYQCVSWNKV